MDELGEPIPVERTLAEEILQSAWRFSESIWPAGIPPENEEERRAVVTSWVARIRGEPTATPPARRFEVACTDRLAAYASLTDEAAAGLTGLPEVHTGSLTEEEGCAVMAALAGRLPALRSLNVTEAQLHALVPVWREMAAAGRPAGLIHLAAGTWRRVAAPPLPSLGNLLPRLRSLKLGLDEPEHVASWCVMLAGEGAPALADLTLPRPSRHRDTLPDEQAAMYVDVLGRQAGSLRMLAIQPYRMSSGAADALDAAIVALPHLVNLRTSTVQVEDSVRVLGGRAPHLRSIRATCRHESLDPAACLTAWARELAPSVERIDLGGLEPRLEGLAAPTWRDLAAALRALGARPTLSSLSLHMRGRDGVPWLQSVLSPPPDVAAAPVWPHLQELGFNVLLLGSAAVNVELDLRHFPHLCKIGSNIISAATVAGVMRSPVCRDMWVYGAAISLAAADAAALAPKERLMAHLSDDTAEETVATLASVVGGWPDLRQLHVLSGDELHVSEATQVALVRALGHCTRLRGLCLPFPFCPAAVDALAEVLPRLLEVRHIGLSSVTTTSLLALVCRLPGAPCGAGDAARTLQASVTGTRDLTTTMDDLRELGSAVAAATQRGWAVRIHSVRMNNQTVLVLLSQVQALALRRDWRDCIVPLSTVDVTPAGYTLQLQPCGLVEWERSEWRCQLLPCLLHAPCTCPCDHVRAEWRDLDLPLAPLPTPEVAGIARAQVAAVVWGWAAGWAWVRRRAAVVGGAIAW
jgi:hypothetical protein